MSHCGWCEEEVAGDEAGVMEVPFIGHQGISRVRFHSACYIRQLVGSVAHQLGHCSCFGGTDEDPPGLSRRQAAQAACELFSELPPRPPIARDRVAS